jgi:hypothetical protein
VCLVPRILENGKSNADFDANSSCALQLVLVEAVRFCVAFDGVCQARGSVAPVEGGIDGDPHRHPVSILCEDNLAVVYVGLESFGMRKTTVEAPDPGLILDGHGSDLSFGVASSNTVASLRVLVIDEDVGRVEVLDCNRRLHAKCKDCVDRVIVVINRLFVDGSVGFCKRKNTTP